MPPTVVPGRKPHHTFRPRPTEWEDESPYPEVRAAVSNTDDMEMPADTLRSWTIGLFWAILIPGLNQFFHFRYPSVTIGSVRRLSPTWT
jgi:hypothetical protein